MEVILPLNLKNSFTYRVPQELNEEAVIGKRVSVPLGKKKILAGLILSIHEHPPTDYQARYIIDIIDNEPIVDSNQLELWKWISNYYMTALGLVYNAAMPAGLKLEGEAKIIINPDFELTFSELDEKEIILLDSVRSGKELTITQAAIVIKTPAIHKFIKSLYIKGAILIKEDIKESYTAKFTTFIRLHEEIIYEEQLNHIFNTLEKRAKNQLKALMIFISNNGINGECEKSSLVKLNVTNAAINGLIDKQVFVQEKREQSRIQFSTTEKEIERLNSEQEKAITTIKDGFRLNKPALIHGVTGSGKTHVYSHLIQEVLDQKKQVLFLLPEIALTSQLITPIGEKFREKTSSISF